MIELAAQTPCREETEENPEEIFQLVSFHVGSEEYAIDILGVQEIIRMVELTPVPQAPHFVEGVINLRGKVIPVLDLRVRFGLPSIKPTNDTRIIVIETNHILLGFIVDSVSEVLRVPESLIEPPLISRQGSDFQKGVGRVEGRLLIVLDLDVLFETGGLAS